MYEFKLKLALYQGFLRRLYIFVEARGVRYETQVLIPNTQRIKVLENFVLPKIHPAG
jgi:hypothetical protein